MTITNRINWNEKLQENWKESFCESGIYSCAVYFLEVSGYLLLPVLPKLTARSRFPELLSSAVSDNQNQGRNPSLLDGIRDHVWSNLRQHCSTFQARDCNASFCQNFEVNFWKTKSWGNHSLCRDCFSYCPNCNENVKLNSKTFLTYVSQSGLGKFGYDEISWPTGSHFWIQRRHGATDSEAVASE